MTVELCRDIGELFPQMEGMFPSVKEILESSTAYGESFHVNNPKPFTINLIEDGLLPEISNRYWKDQIIVDLGSGRKTHAYGLACIAKAKAYVPIEKFHMSYWLNKFVGGKQWNTPLKDFEELKGEEFERVPVYPVHGDMCQFLSKLPDKSVGILIAGIDRIIVDEFELFEGEKRLEVLTREISRVISPESSCIDYMSFLDLDLELTEDLGGLRVFGRG